MLANFHTHTTFCDGKNTPEKIVIAAIERGFSAIGFSGHGYTPFDLRYCMKDTAGYVVEIEELKRKYKSKIQIYIGVEEDAFAPVDRSKLDFTVIFFLKSFNLGNVSFGILHAIAKVKWGVSVP